MWAARTYVMCSFCTVCRGRSHARAFIAGWVGQCCMPERLRATLGIWSPDATSVHAVGCLPATSNRLYRFMIVDPSVVVIDEIFWCLTRNRKNVRASVFPPYTSIKFSTRYLRSTRKQAFCLNNYQCVTNPRNIGTNQASNKWYVTHPIFILTLCPSFSPSYLLSA